MQVGFMTNSLVWAGLNDLDEIAKWAKENGFSDLEIGPNVPLEEKIFSAVTDDGKLQVSSLIYCRNFLSDNADEAASHKAELLKRIEFAPKVGIKKVICSTGVNSLATLENNPIKYDPEACVEIVAETFKEIVELAEKNDVKICFENCPLMGNIAITPYMWQALFARLGSNKVGLAFDPSHLVWQFVDPYSAIKNFGDRIFHVHGKDCEIDRDRLAKVGILHNFSNMKGHVGVGENALEKMWWRYRLVGLGELNWSKIVANLQEVGYDGTISIEHEDPVWEGSVPKVKEGLLKAKRHLETFI